MKKIEKKVYSFIIGLAPFLSFSSDVNHSDNIDLSSEIIAAKEVLEGINTFNADMKKYPENFDVKRRIIRNHDFSGKCLRGVDFSDWELINVNFEGADLRNANFTGASFPWFMYKGYLGYLGKNFKMNGALLADGLVFDKTIPHFELVKLYSYFITHDKIEKAKGLNIVLPHLKLNLKRKNLSNLNLSGINLDGTNLCGASLENTNLRDSVLTYVEMKNTVLKGADLKRANLRHSILVGTNFSKASLKCTDFSQALIDNINLSDAVLKKTKFSEAGLMNTDLTGADCRNVIIENSALTGIYSDSYVNPLKKYAKVVGYTLPVILGTDILLRKCFE